MNIIHKLWRIAGLSISKVFSRRALRKFLRQEVGNIKAGSSVLSVGSGGEVGDRLKNCAKMKDYRLMQVDIDPEREPDLVGDICSIKFDEAFDVIFVVEVLEHVISPEDAVSNLQQALKPGGRIVGSTPFIFPIHDAPHDHFRFTRFQLKKLLSSFDRIDITEKSGVFETIVVLSSRIVLSDNKLLVLFATPINVILLFLWPIAIFLDRVFPSKYSPIGYMFTASSRISSK